MKKTLLIMLAGAILALSASAADYLVETNLTASTTSIVVMPSRTQTRGGRISAVVSVAGACWYSKTLSANVTNSTPLQASDKLQFDLSDPWNGPISIVSTASVNIIVQEVYRD